MIASVETVGDVAAAAALLNPLRLQMLEALREPDSAAGIARKLGLRRQKVNYHLREMEEVGLIELVEERRKGNCHERVMRAKARSFVVDPQALGALSPDPDHLRDQFSTSYLLALAAKVIRDIATLRTRARRAAKRLPTLSIQSEIRFANPRAQAAFAVELREEFARLVEKYHDESAPGGRRFHVISGSYPVITKGADP